MLGASPTRLAPLAAKSGRRLPHTDVMYHFIRIFGNLSENREFTRLSKRMFSSIYIPLQLYFFIFSQDFFFCLVKSGSIKFDGGKLFVKQVRRV
jgi:hypothetical protein